MDPSNEGLLKGICRTCMSQQRNLLSIFEFPNESDLELCFADVLKLTIPQLEIETTNELSKEICNSCVDKLISYWEFQKMCIKSENSMRELIAKEIELKNESASAKDPLKEDDYEIDIDDVAQSGSGIVLDQFKMELCDIDDSAKAEMIDEQHIKLDDSETLVKIEEHTQNHIGNFEMKPVGRHGDDGHTNGCKDSTIRKRETENVLDIDHHISRNQIKSAGRSYACNICNNSFSSSSHLKRHERNIHKSRELSADQRVHNASHLRSSDGTPKGEHACNECGKTFKKLSLLLRHKRTHEKYKNNDLNNTANDGQPARPHVCEYCNKAFQQICTLKDHVRTHTGEQPFLCSECGRAFSSASNMRQHLLRHTGEKRYECPQCPKKFPCLSDLASHKAVHGKVKPHACDMCGAAFGKPYQLKKHKMYHNGEKPYKCEYCEMRFVCAHHMRRHMRTHTGEKPYKCTHCDRAFAQSNDLIKHLRSHLGENVYKCDLCPRAFRLATELRAHFAEHKKTDDVTGN